MQWMAIFLILILHCTGLFAQSDSTTHSLEKRIFALKKLENFNVQDTTYILLVNRLSERYVLTKLDTLFIMANDMLNVSNKIHFEKGRIVSLCNLADYHLHKGNVQDVIQITDSVINNKVFFPKYVQHAYNQLGKSYLVKGDYSGAFLNFKKSIDQAVKNKDIDQEILLRMNMGTLFNLLGNYDTALEHYNYCLDLIDKNTYTPTKGKLYSNIGFLFVNENKPDSALGYLNQSASIFNQYDLPAWLAFTYVSMGNLNLKNNENEKALEFFVQAETIHEKITDIKGKADTYLGMGKSYFALKQLSTAEKYLNKSLGLYESFHLNSGMEKCYRALYLLNKEKHQTSAALGHLEKAEEYAKLISKEQNTANVSLILTQQKFEDEKEKISMQTKDMVDKQRAYIRWSTAALIISIILVVIIVSSIVVERKLRKKLEEKTEILTENEEKLNQSNVVKDKLFSIIGHDLRGPIVSLRSLVDLCLEEKKTGETLFREYAPKLKIKLDHIQFTLDNLLNWGQSQMKGSTINATEIAVKKQIDRIVGLYKDNLIKKSITFTNSVDEDLKVFADLDHFNIVFRNLINNAIKFTYENGKITTSAQRKNNMLIITVQDTGIGMDKNTISKVLNSSEHFSTFGTYSEKGTGLGLLLSKEMILKNKGTITIESEPKKGSIFHIVLPAA